MQHQNQKISAVPTTIITGFLGVGKSSAILHLLKHKPDNERWAVLVNEFGEIGVDGSLFEGVIDKGMHRSGEEEQQVFIREIPGGCMCCTAWLPMQVALNQLLKTARPDRLLIEPTGLGHPQEVLQSLTSEAYREVIDLQPVLTLVDARKLSDSRYTEHKTFQQQVAIADIVVGNKQDLYQLGDQEKLQDYVKHYGSPKAQVIFTQQGEIPTTYLVGDTGLSEAMVDGVAGHHHHHDHDHAEPLLSEGPLPACGYVQAVNQGEGFYSVGWRLSEKYRFDVKRLSSFLQSITAERIKAVCITGQGDKQKVVGFNLTSDDFTQIDLQQYKESVNSIESRIEIIATAYNEQWHDQLMACCSE